MRSAPERHDLQTEDALEDRDNDTLTQAAFLDDLVDGALAIDEGEKERLAGIEPGARAATRVRDARNVVSSDLLNGDRSCRADLIHTQGLPRTRVPGFSVFRRRCRRRNDRLTRKRHRQALAR